MNITSINICFNITLNNKIHEVSFAKFSSRIRNVV